MMGESGQLSAGSFCHDNCLLVPDLGRHADAQAQKADDAPT